MSIYLIRHGKTAANEQHRYCGSTDLPLSKQGIRELNNLHYQLRAEYYMTSGMRRCNETLRILFGNVPFTVDERFREVDFGRFEMRSYEELKDDPEYISWIAGDNEKNIPPEGESGEAQALRVKAAWKNVKDGTVLVTHGGVIAILMQMLFPNEEKSRYAWQPRNGCGYEISADGWKMIL